MTSSSGHLCCCLVLRVQTEPWDSTHKHQTSPQCFYFVSEVWWCVQVLLVENRSCLHLFNQYILLSVNRCELMLTEIQVSSRVQVLISSFSSAAWSIPLLSQTVSAWWDRIDQGWSETWIMSSDVTVTWTEPQLPPQQSFGLVVPPCGRREEVQEETPSQIHIEHLNRKSRSRKSRSRKSGSSLMKSSSSASRGLVNLPAALGSVILSKLQYEQWTHCSESGLQSL